MHIHTKPDLILRVLKIGDLQIIFNPCFAQKLWSKLLIF